MQENTTPFLTTEEIAASLRIHVKTVRAWIASGELPALDLGQGYRVSVHDLTQFLDTRKRRRSDRQKPTKTTSRQFKHPF